MENLQRRASGIYFARLTVPAGMRHIVGQREFIATTGTHHLPVAKLDARLISWYRPFTIAQCPSALRISLR